MPKYESKLGPIPDGAFEDEVEPNPEMMAKRTTPESMSAMSDLLKKRMREAKVVRDRSSKPRRR